MWCWWIRPEGDPSINYTDVIRFLSPPEFTNAPAGAWQVYYNQTGACVSVSVIQRWRFAISTMNSSFLFCCPAHVFIVGLLELVLYIIS